MKNIRPISLLLVIFSLSLFFSYHIYYYCLNLVNNKMVNNYLDKKDEKIKSVVEKATSNQEDFLGILEIPKIHFKKGFYNLNSTNNDVNKNIQLLKASNMPDVPNGSMFIAAHSGNSYLGYFKDLDKLKINDEVYIHYQSNKYIYIISSVFEQEKNGQISIIKNSGDTIIVLTTCKKGENKQLVIMAKLIKKL